MSDSASPRERITAAFAELSPKQRRLARFILDHEDVVAFASANDIGGHPEIVRAMLAGGVKRLGESRLKHVRRLREAGIDVDIMMLRLPALSEVDDIVDNKRVEL